MRFASLLVALPFTLLVACGGSETPPAESADDVAAAEPAAADEAPAESAGSTPAAGEDGWEGESAATDKPADGAKATAGGTAPPDAKGEETRTIELISKLVKDQRKPVRECYEKARKDLPDLK